MLKGAALLSLGRRNFSQGSLSRFASGFPGSRAGLGPVAEPHSTGSWESECLARVSGFAGWLGVISFLGQWAFH